MKLSTAMELDVKGIQFYQWIYIYHILTIFDFFRYNREKKQERIQNFKMFADCGFMIASITNVLGKEQHSVS